MEMEEITGCHLENGKIGDWNVQDSIKFFNDKGYSKTTNSGGRCWEAVKNALLKAKFKPIKQQWAASAYMAEHYLPTVGFVKIDEGVFKASAKIEDEHNQILYGKPQTGDITVFRNCHNHPHGHIHMWVENKWVSDYSCARNRINRNCSGSYTVWRYSGKGKQGI